MVRFSTMARIALLFLFLTGSYVHAASDSTPTFQPSAKQSSSQPKDSSAVTPATKEAASAKKYKDGELLVKFRKEASEQGKKNLHKKHGAEKLNDFAELRLHHVKLKEGMTVEDAVKEYQADPDVEYADPNYLFSIQSLPNDAKFSEQWALHNTGQTGGTPGADIKAPAAWDITTGSSQVVVAILDTGIDYTHPDLAANIYSGYQPFDTHGHGTHVAGIIGAVGNNGLGVTGVNWNIKMTACKCVDDGGYASSDAVVSCLQWVKNQKKSGVNIVATNNSWAANNGYYGAAVEDAVRAQGDILFIAAAGNGGADLDSYGVSSLPNSSQLPNAIVVAASDDKDYKSDFSYFGRYSAHLTAPGEGILSTLPASNKYGVAGGYGALSGTSMAAPYVTGVAALLKAQDPSRNWATIKNLILSGGDDTNGSYGRTVTGKRLSAYGSLACSNAPVFAVQRPPYRVVSGTPVTLSALSINCGSAAGPVTVTARDGQVVTLADDGVAPDAAANDGVFTASFLPTRDDEILIFSSPAGTRTLEYPRTAITSSGPTWTMTETFQGPVVTTSLLLNPSLNLPYTGALSVEGGYAPHQWRVASGALPPGITMSPAGEISGSATSAGSYYFTVEVSDAYGAKDIKNLSLTVTQAGYSEAWRKTVTAVDNAPPWGATENKHSDIAIDRDGNSYVTSQYTWGAPSLAKHDPAGNQLWTKTLDPEIYQAFLAVAVDQEANVFVAGYTSNSSRHWLLKFDRDGKELWRRDGPSSTGWDVATDAFGNAYVMTSTDIVKYDGAGNELWTKPQQLSKNISRGSITVDAAGNIYLTGSQGTAYYSERVLLARYDGAGNLVWSRTYDSSRSEVGQEVVVNSKGEIFIAASSLAAPLTGYLMKVDPSGALLWKKPYSAGKGVKFTGVALDAMDQLYVTGSGLFSPYGGSDLLILKHDSDGNVLWAMTPDTGGVDYGDQVAIGAGGEIVVSTRATNDVMIIKYSHDAPMVSLDYNRQGSGAGSVRLSPGGILPASSSRLYEPATVVTLTAVPEVDSIFTGWGGACSGTGTCTVTMDQQRQVNATFEHKAIALNYTSLGDGGGRVSFTSGAACFGSCDHYYDADTQVTLSAVATGTSVFTGWGGACSGTGTCTVLMDQAKGVTATFVHGPRVSYHRGGTGNGWVRFIPEGADPTMPDFCYDDNCTREYSPGTRLTITAQSSPSGTFTGWSGACTGTGACNLTLSEDTVTTATFTRLYGKASLAAGFGHTLALFGDTLWGWGDNSYSELGSVPNMFNMNPVQVTAPPLTKVAAARSGFSSAGIGTDGSVWMWGEYSQIVQIDGTWYFFGSSEPVKVPGVSEAVDVALGSYHGLALKADGTLWGWGYSGGGQLGVASEEWRLPPMEIPGMTGFVGIAAGMGHSVALKGDGTVWAWGYNAKGEAGVDPALFHHGAVPAPVEGVSGVVAIAAGDEHTLALKGDGTVLTWGLNDFGQLGDGTRTDRFTPQTVTGLSGVTAIAAGSGFSMALKNDGTVWMWGENEGGQLGIGTLVNQSLPVQVQGLSGVVGITAGTYHSVAETSDGTLWSWGVSGTGALGDGTMMTRTTPVRVAFFRGTHWPAVLPITTASPAGGSYDTTQTVTLTANRSAAIYYTLDGSEPTSASAVYTAPLTISSTTVLKFFAVDTDGNAEGVKTRTYTFPVFADFTSSVTAGNAPLTVSFSDLTTGNPTSWLWSFGDGATDTAQNPVHVYSGAGSYTVSLTAAKTGATDTKTKHRHIVVQKCEDAPVRVRGAMVTSFADLVNAYAQAADNDVLELQEYNFSDSLLFDREIRLSLKGGYNCGYQDNPAAAGIFGKLTVKAGSVKLENIRLR